MMVDGEWRVSFIAAEHPELKYGTAPMPVAEGSELAVRIGLHQRHHHRHPEEREEQGRLVGARQVPDDERPRARHVLERDPQRALDEELGPVEGAEAGPELRDVHEDLREPEVADGADHDRGPAYLDTFANFLAKWQAGNVKDLAAVSRDVDKQIDAKLKQSGGGVSVIDAGSRGGHRPGFAGG